VLAGWVCRPHNQAIKHRPQAGWTNYALLLLCFFRYASPKKSTQNLPLMAALAPIPYIESYTHEKN